VSRYAWETSVMSEPEFKSSPARLSRLFRHSRDNWRQRAADKQRAVKKLRITVRDLCESRDHWKAVARQQSQEIAALRLQLEQAGQELSPPCSGQLASAELSAPKGHRHSLLVIRLCLRWYLDAHVSLRGVSEVLLSLVSVLSDTLSLSLPYHQTVRSWLLRCGLFLLRRDVPPRDDWVWIVDCTIRIGQKKCLLILGVSLEQLRAHQGALEHHQVVVLDLWVTAHCTGLDIEKRLKGLAQRVGVPKQIVSDHSSDLSKGVRLFQADNPVVVDTYDVTHKLACLVKAELKADQRWAEFLRDCTSSLFQLQQSRGAFLTPPGPRSLERYMNVDRHTEWATRMLAVLDMPDKTLVAELLGLDVQEANSFLEEKLGWLRGFRQEVTRFQRFIEAVKQTEEEVKNHGLSRQTAARLWKRMPTQLRRDASLREFLMDLKGYLKEEGNKVPAEQAWLGTSDVIESLFGKYKCFLEKSPDGEVGASVLALPLLTVDLTAELVQEALLTVSAQDVRSWANDSLGPSNLAKVCTLSAAIDQPTPSSSEDTDSA
jgi:transposase-like protein